MPKKIYHYSKDDGRYLELPLDAPYELGVAMESPLEDGAYLIPAFATDIAPPSLVADKWPVFADGLWSLVNYITSKTIYSTVDGGVIEPQLGKSLADMSGTVSPMPQAKEHEHVAWKDDAWLIQPDWRGAEYWLSDGTHHVINELGVVKPAGALDAPPPLQAHVPTEKELIQAAQVAVQSALDAKARERGYDGILSLCSYAASKNPQFCAEGQAGVDWRDAAWSALYLLQGKIQSGQVPAPSTVAESQALALSVIPDLVWPI